MFKLYQTDAGVRQQLVVIGFRMSACYLLLYLTDFVNEFFLSNTCGLPSLQPLLLVNLPGHCILLMSKNSLMFIMNK